MFHRKEEVLLLCSDHWMVSPAAEHHSNAVIQRLRMQHKEVTQGDEDAATQRLFTIKAN